MEPLSPACDGPLPHSAALGAGGTHELWLMRVPRHSVLRKSLVGRTVSLGDAGAPNTVRGNYRFADAGRSAAARALRPLLASAGRYVLGPRFARQVDVEFAGSAMAPAARRQAAREYPEAVEERLLVGRFRPIGVGQPVGLAGGGSAVVGAMEEVVEAGEEMVEEDVGSADRPTQVSQESGVAEGRSEGKSEGKSPKKRRKKGEGRKGADGSVKKRRKSSDGKQR